MKATELMIGDLVKYTSKYSCGIGKVAGIEPREGTYPPKTFTIIPETNDSKSILLIGVSKYNIEPIPLTPEILEKNGFYYGYTSNEEDTSSNTIAQLSEQDKGWVWDEGDGAIKVIFPNEADGGLVWIDDQCFDRDLSFLFSENIFVHELQHTLRLCGINKEIEL